jgi:hypothetical protein
LPQQIFTFTDVERPKWTTGQVPLSTDLDAIAVALERRLQKSQQATLLADPLGLLSFPHARFVGDALQPTADQSALKVSIAPGTVFWVTSGTPATSQPATMHLLTQTQEVILDAAPGTVGQSRIDIFSLKVETDANVNSSSRVIYTLTGPTTVSKSTQSIDPNRRTKLTITYTPGTAAASPAAPSIPAGEIEFARITVSNGDTVADYTLLTDRRIPAGWTTRHVSLVETRNLGGWTAQTDSRIQASAASDSARMILAPMSRRGPMRLARIIVNYFIAAGGSLTFGAQAITAVATASMNFVPFNSGSGSFAGSNLAITTGAGRRDTFDPARVMWHTGFPNMQQSRTTTTDFLQTQHSTLAGLMATAGASGDDINGIDTFWWGF